MGQAADRVANFQKGRRFRIWDGDSNFRWRFRIVLEDAGISLIRTLYRAPNANTHAERLVGSIWEECVNPMILFGEGHLRRVIAEYMAHFNHERNHQGIGNELIDGPQLTGTRPVECTQRLGGLLKFYRRAA